MRKLLVLLTLMVALSVGCPADARDKKKTRRIKKPTSVEISPIEKTKQSLIDNATEDSTNAQAIIELKLKLLDWKKKYYAERSVNMQLKSILQCWNDPNYQEAQKIIRDTDREARQLSILR